MSSEILGGAENTLKGNLGGAWDIKHGYADAYTDLGVARRFGGAAAAYSLRDIGAMNGRVVNVRREPHDTSAGIDDEINFSANQVSSGALEDWVNGKLESTLPADVATAAAAYSLRKVKDSYSGDAVRIRRSSDDIEVDVAFDSDDKVSASSAITNLSEEGGEIGSTTATTVAEFLSEERTTFITNPVMTTVSGDITVLSNTTSSTEFTFTFSGSTGDGFVRHNGKPDNLGADIGDTVSFDITASGLNQQCGVRARRTGANNDAISPGINNIDNGTQTITFTVTSNGPVGYFAFVNLGSASTGTIRVHNLKVVGKSAFVHTWYDQAGSNNAVQDTDANQPKIAESGALLADGVTFDGSNDFLQTSTQVLTGTETSANSMYAVINQASGDDGYICGSSATDVGGNKMGQSLYGAGSSQNKVVLNNGNDASGGTNDNITIIEGSFYLISSCYNNNNTNTLQTNGGTTGYANGSTPYDFNAGTLFTIGARKDSTTASTVLFTGSMKEIIAYDSDQLANRFKIESNINNYYGLYNDENEFSANPTAEVTPSAITLTNVSKTGFTAEISSTGGTKQINFPLLNSLVSGYDYFVSFDYTSTSTSTVGVKPRTAALGSASNDVISATNSGFYGGTGDSQHNGFDVNNTATILSFQTTANSFTFTVSNLRVSRINRHGCVETWYDQSGNLRHAIQSDDTKQPTIVSNGSLVTLNSKPVITFDGNDNFLEVDGTGSAATYSFSPSGDMGMFIVSKQSVGNVIDSRDAGGDGVFLQQASANTTRFRYNASSNNIDVTATRDVRHLSVLTLDGTTLSASVDGGTATSKTVTAGVSTTKNLVLGKAFSGNNSNFLDGEIQEAIFYERKQTHNLPAIKANINNQYQIYS